MNNTDKIKTPMWECKMFKELDTIVGTKNVYLLSGDHDQDMFLREDDMGTSHWELLMGCYHQGLDLYCVF